MYSTSGLSREGPQEVGLIEGRGKRGRGGGGAYWDILLRGGPQSGRGGGDCQGVLERAWRGKFGLHATNFLFILCLSYYVFGARGARLTWVSFESPRTSEGLVMASYIGLHTIDEFL